MGNCQSNSTSIEADESIISRRTNDTSIRSGTSYQPLKPILKTSSYTNLAEKGKESPESDISHKVRIAKRDSFRKLFSSSKEVRPVRKNNNEEYNLQRQENSYAQSRENLLIHKILSDDIKDFLKSDVLSKSNNKDILESVGKKMLDMLSEDKYPESSIKTDEDGEILYDRLAKKPLTQYNSANYLSIPSYFRTTEGTWNTIAMHIQSSDKKSNDSLDKEYPYTEKNIKQFLGELGNFVLPRTNEQTKEEMLKHVDPKGSDAERYRHFVERLSYKTVRSSIERQLHESKGGVSR
jgi:hypothetical protein